MPIGKITKRSVESLSLPQTGKRSYLWDDTLKGFAVMVTDKGVRSYIVQYRLWGRGSPTRRVTIGKHGSPWTAEKARDRASELLEQVRRKIDPFEAEREAKRSAEQAESEAKAREAIAERLAFDAVAKAYVSSKKNKLRTWRTIEAVINRDLIPEFGSASLPTITSADICDLLSKVGKRGDGAARAVYSTLSAIFVFAAESHGRYFRVSDSPMRDVPTPAKSVKRQRLLNEAELRTIWHSAGGLGWPFSDIVRLLMLTGQRLREVAHARWSEFDLAKAEWLIPAERTKNKLPMIVHLSPQAILILKGLPKIKSEQGYLFTTTGKTPVSGFSRAKARLDAIIVKALSENDESMMTEWRLHDIRRSMSTNCQRLGISPEVVDLMQNHVEGANSGTKGSYQLYRYHLERRAAFAEWGNEVMRIIQKPSTKQNLFELAEQLGPFT